jgi:hypothetical protein
MVFCVLTISLVDGCQCFRGACWLHLKDWNEYVEDVVRLHMQVARNVVAQIHGQVRGDRTLNRKCEKSSSFQDHSNY